MANTLKRASDRAAVATGRHEENSFEREEH